MRYTLHITSLGFICLLILVASCKKSTSEFNFNTAMTATFNGTTQQYVVPSGFVGTTINYNYQANGYIASASSNTIQMQITDSISAVDSLRGGGNGSYFQITNNGTTYSSVNNLGASAGVINVNFNGNKITGTFSGTLYEASSAYSKDSLVVTNGTINTSY